MGKSVKVRLKAIVEINVGVWGIKGDMEPLVIQAKREGTQMLQNLIKAAGGTIINEPKVILIFAEEE